jgi:uncharacterized Zn finger protein (UPF0148 family)
MPRKKIERTEEEKAAIKEKQKANLKKGGIEEFPRAPDGTVLPKETPLIDEIDDPEDELAAMKRVLAGNPAKTPLDDAFKDFLSRDPTRFMARKRELETPPPAEPAEGGTGPSLPPLVKDGETPCPLCGQVVYPDDEEHRNALLDAQLRDIPNLPQRIRDLEFELAERDEVIRRLRAEQVVLDETISLLAEPNSAVIKDLRAQEAAEGDL